MKKTLSIFAVLILISSVVFAGGIDDPSSTKVVVSENGLVVKVFYKSEFKNVRISIINTTGTVVFSEIVHNNKNGFVRPYNLSKLTEGEYTFSIEDENGKRDEKVTVAFAKPELLSAIIKLKGERKFAVTLAGKNDASAYVVISDQSQNIVYEERFEAGKGLTKLFDLSNIKGPVTLEVIGNDGTVVSKTID